ncbi:T9SS type A sorting domain-containing protein [candidate division KSB1 bacterium]|nr:T9SS type A sorting domain-containing protein [candidate division KSB1 bacterium]
MGERYNTWRYQISQIRNFLNLWPAYVRQHLLDYFGGDIAVDSDVTTSPVAFQLLQNYPNPFNPTTAISYRLAAFSDVKLTIFNLQGQAVQVPVQRRQPAGNYSVTWDGRDQKGYAVTSGMYFTVLETPGFREIRKMMRVR